MNRWRIMALLVEALERRQYVPVAEVTPPGARPREVEAVMWEAGMVQVAQGTWTPGRTTLAWVSWHVHGIANPSASRSNGEHRSRGPWPASGGDGSIRPAARALETDPVTGRSPM